MVRSNQKKASIENATFQKIGNSNCDASQSVDVGNVLCKQIILQNSGETMNLSVCHNTFWKSDKIGEP